MNKGFWGGVLSGAVAFAAIEAALLAIAFIPRVATHVARVRGVAEDLVGARGVRRLVTGYDSTEKSVIVSDQDAPRSQDFGDARYVEVWRTQTSPALIVEGAPPDPTAGPLSLAQLGGSVLRVVDFPPASAGGKRTPMHRTRTVDYGIVLEGQIALVLDDSVATLKPGDIVIQRGANHAWENRSDKTARMAFVLLDGKFDHDLAMKLPDTSAETFSPQ